MGRRIRTFVALELPTPLRSALKDLQADLSVEKPDVKWVEPENLHLTLQFLGEIDDRDLVGVCRAVSAAAAMHEPFRFIVGGIGAFPNVRRPRVLYADVKFGREELTALHADLDDRLSATGSYRREEREWTPHITLGRPSAEETEGWDRLLRTHAAWDGGEAAVREVVVMGSELRRTGPSYVVMARSPLTG